MYFYNDQILICFYTILIVCFCESFNAELQIIRGISLSRASLYSPDIDFTCLDSSRSIPYLHVNDDYCDCGDGSDEPGTSACSNGVFYCINSGYKPYNIGASKVNDGVCDCCDGSDEYANRRTKCTNKCFELGKAAKEEIMRKEELLNIGRQVRKELSRKGFELKQEKTRNLVEFQNDKQQAEALRHEKEKIKNQWEEKEKVALEYYKKLEEEENLKKAELEAEKDKAQAINSFLEFDLDQDGTLTAQELQENELFDKDKNGEVSEEEAKYFLNMNEYVEEDKYLTDCWQNVKPVLLTLEASTKAISTESTTVINEEETQIEQEFNPDEGEEQIEGEDEDEDDQEEEEKPSEQVEETVEEIPLSKQYDQETQKLVDAATQARSDFNEADKQVKKIESEISLIESYLAKDFGLDEEFASLQSECFEYEDHEYVYKLCPFNDVIQKPKSGSAETRLGSWGSWTGSESNKYETMLYEKGQACWNGPQRSAQVKVICGSENRITSVSEPNKCEYVLEFETPATCSENESDFDMQHDEL